ncbi:hypothetical protein BC831DRAFT_108111 [Entophlyctis helioformis]|nr:hypothetical protein BC831DRAFT_108111 [Entophlyctis helioformis]
MANSVNQRWTQIRAVAQPKLAQCPFAIPSVRYEWLGKGNVCTFLFDMPQVVDGFAASKSHNDLLGMLEAAASNAACGHPDKLAKTLGEEDAVTCDLAMSLQCPLTMVRIRLPARSLKCKHPSCFDLERILPH